MTDFWDFVKLIAILGTIITGLVLILLSLPRSRLQEFLLKIFSGIFFTIAGFFTLYIISPIDFIPDFIPLLGQIDDIAASIAVVLNAIAGFYMLLQRQYISNSKPDSTPRIEPPKDIEQTKD
jgi:hypothetical protein